ncbi:6-phosphogluconolactonase [Cellulophaga baltica]|uniref:6-phosphogluconolactonase n=1 Tax=Cellulophaga TaxID=104264 RepID=UPI001C07D1DE|nr:MULTISPECIES: 6-phosphogluconolactonase [Cellulophaga]MBU2997405.1 6-phosphogluconolactonase [Cellulophaga baltica]MDO6768802.1 6-phosphogluconolactonase [Cellulophaga sp. 1_MG-2023]
MQVRIYNTKQIVAEKFSEFFKDIAKGDAVFNVALSGGSTPKIVFDYLASNFAKDIDWSNIHFYWGDERCVAPTDDDSNYKMTVEHLLSKIEIPEANIHRILGENDPKEEAVRYRALLDKNLAKAHDIPQFDLVILGMGDDGHTASVFPHEIELWDSSENCEVAIHPDSGQKRVSLTGKIINNAVTVAFLVTGAGKAPKVKEIIKEVDNYKDYPATLVKPTTNNLIWFLDVDAAKLIS